MSVENRLAALERSARRWRVAAVSLGLALLLLLGLGADKPTHFDSVFAKSFVLVDDKDGVIGTLGIGDDGKGTKLSLAGGTDKDSPKLLMLARPAGLAILLDDSAGCRATIAVRTNQSAIFNVINDKTRATVGFSSDQGGANVVATSPDKSQAMLVATPDSGSFVVIRDASGKSVLSESARK